MLIKKILCGIILILSGVNLLSAVVPDTLTIQGRLSTSGPLTGVKVDILRDGVIAQSLEPFDLETDVDGVFTAVLSGINKSIFSTGSIFTIAFSASNGDLLGTVLLNSVPFSIRSESSVSADSAQTITGPLNMAANQSITLSGTGKVTGLADPSQNLDAVNKQYVDTTFIQNPASPAPVQGDILYHDGTSWVKLSAGMAGQILRSGGTGANPYWDTLIPDTQAPSVPTNLTATPASSTQINLGWTASTDDVGVASYKIYRDGGATPIARPTGTTYNNTGLTASTAYSYSVSACDAAGNCSAQSTAASATTAAPLPQFCSVAGDGKTSAIVNGAVVFCDNSLKLWTPTIPLDGAVERKIWDSAVNYCETLTYAGYGDWVLPSCASAAPGTGCQLYAFGMDACGWTANGAQSICRPAWDTNAMSGSYWSSFVPDPGSAKVVNFDVGGVYNLPKTFDIFARCVRAP